MAKGWGGDSNSGESYKGMLIELPCVSCFGVVALDTDMVAFGLCGQLLDSSVCSLTLSLHLFSWLVCVKTS